MRLHRPLAAILILLTGSPLSPGLAEDRLGPDKDHDHPTVEQPGWPPGMVEILRHDSRVYSVWVNGNSNYYFKSTPGEIGELLKLFSETRLRDHVVTIKKGQPEAKAFNLPKGIPYNVNVHVMDGIALAMSRNEGEAKTFEPTLTIFVGPDDDLAMLKQLVIPENIILRSELPTWPVERRAALPARKAWLAEVRFEGGKPAVDFEAGVSTQVTFWEEGEERPVRLGTVNHEGFFHAAFSDKEMARLKGGEAWLTLTPGNYLTEPAPEDEKLPVERLVRKRAEARAVTISPPAYYHGRILFEDGTPAILDPEPWPGAQLAVSFPFAGRTELDEEGYFRLYFSPAQFEEMKAQTVRKNVYIPSFKNRGRSSALYAFPASDLSLDKETAGVLRIAKPGPRKNEGNRR